MECKIEQNLLNCNCSYPCCECVAYHRKKGELPGCYFTNEAEKTYDRSIENYLRTRKQS